MFTALGWEYDTKPNCCFVTIKSFNEKLPFSLSPIKLSIAAQLYLVYGFERAVSSLREVQGSPDLCPEVGGNSWRVCGMELSCFNFLMLILGSFTASELSS